MSFNVHLLKTTSFIPPTMSEGASMIRLAASMFLSPETNCGPL